MIATREIANLKTNLTIPVEMVCIWKKRTRWQLPSRGS